MYWEYCSAVALQHSEQEQEISPDCYLGYHLDYPDSVSDGSRTVHFFLLAALHCLDLLPKHLHCHLLPSAHLHHHHLHGYRSEPDPILHLPVHRQVRAEHLVTELVLTFLVTMVYLAGGESPSQVDHGSG